MHGLDPWIRFDKHVMYIFPHTWLYRHTDFVLLIDILGTSSRSVAYTFMICVGVLEMIILSLQEQVHVLGTMDIKYTFSVWSRNIILGLLGLGCLLSFDPSLSQ